MIDNDVLEKPLQKEYSDIFGKIKDEGGSGGPGADESQKPTAEDIAFLSVLNKRTGKEFKTVTEADEYLKKTPPPPPPVPLTAEELKEQEEKEYVNFALNQKGIKVSDLARYKELESKTPADFARASLEAKLKEKNPNISQQDIDRKFNALYFINKDGESLYDAEDNAVGQARIEAEGKRYQESLLKPYTEARREFSRTKTAMNDSSAWANKVNEKLSAEKEILLSFSDKESTKIILDDGLKAIISPYLNDPYKFFKDHVNGVDDKLDINKFHNIVTKALLFDKIIGEAKNYGVSIGHDGVAAPFRNPAQPIIQSSIPGSGADHVDGNTIGK